MPFGNISNLGRCRTICSRGDGGRGTNASATVAVATVGLRILTRSDDPPNNIVVKSSLSKGTQNRGMDVVCCFLRVCALCRKKFGQDEDIYMYSGEGYCSVECRERQIEINEMKKLQESTERMSASPGRCSHRDYSPSTNEVRLLGDELRRRRGLIISPKTRTVLS